MITQFLPKGKLWALVFFDTNFNSLRSSEKHLRVTSNDEKKTQT